MHIFGLILAKLLIYIKNIDFLTVFFDSHGFHVIEFIMYLSLCFSCFAHKN